MEKVSELLALCAGNWPVTGEFPSQMPVTRSFGVSFYLRLNKRLSKQSLGLWFETPSGSLWRHSNGADKDMSTSEVQTSAVIVYTLYDSSWSQDVSSVGGIVV